MGLGVALVMLTGVAVGVAVQRAARTRRVAAAVVAVLFAAWMLYEDGLRTERFWLFHSAATLGEFAVVLAFVETRAWRWSWVPALLVVGELLYLLIPAPGPRLVIKRQWWLVQLVLLLIASVASRAIAEEDQPRAPGGHSDSEGPTP